MSIQVSVDFSEGLARKLKVTIPNEKFEQAYNTELSEFAKKVRLDGFRAGKVPLTVVKQRYGAGLRQEIVQKLVQSSLVDALEQESLKPAAIPNIEQLVADNGKPIEFVAAFDIVPEFDLIDFKEVPIEQKVAKIDDSDVDETLARLQKHHCHWHETDQPVATGNKVVVDLTGYLDNEALESETAVDQEILMDEDYFLPEIREGLIGAKMGEERRISVDIPENSPRKPIAGKKVDYVMVVKKIYASELPELNDEFAGLLGIKEGGIATLRTEVANNLRKDIEQRLRYDNHQVIFDKLRELNPIDLPQSLIEQELAGLKTQHIETQKSHHPDAPTALSDETIEKLTEQARKQIHLRMLLQKRIADKSLKPDEKKLQEKLLQMAQSYSDPRQLISLYQDNEQMRNHLEGLVLEEQVVADLLTNAQIKEQEVSYNELKEEATTTA